MIYQRPLEFMKYNTSYVLICINKYNVDRRV